MIQSPLGLARRTTNRRRVGAYALLLSVLLVVLVALQARDAMKRAWVKSWVSQTEELGTFVRGALASRSDLLLVERLVQLARRDEIAYALILDPGGRARYHSNAADIGRRYDNVYTKRALKAQATLVQDIRDHGVLEVDVPLASGVLRVGFTFKPLASFSRWLWAGVALSCACLTAAGLLLLKVADTLNKKETR